MRTELPSESRWPLAVRVIGRLLMVTTATTALLASANALWQWLENGVGQLHQLEWVWFISRATRDLGWQPVAAAPDLAARPFPLTGPLDFLWFGAHEIAVQCVLAWTAVLFVLPVGVLVARGTSRAEPLPARLTAGAAAAFCYPAVYYWLRVWLDYPRWYVTVPMALLSVVLIVAAVGLCSRARRLWDVLRAGARAWAALAIAACGLVLIAQAVPHGTARVAAGGGRPNVLLISIDTLRRDHLGVYGYDRPTSPAIDRLARDGVVFNTAVSSSSWTLPAHVGLMTGLPNAAHQVNNERRRIRSSDRPVGEVFSDQGYATAAFVSGAYLMGFYGFYRGFDVYDDRLAFEVGQLVTPRLLERAGTWLERRRPAPNAPYFLFLHIFDVHDPYNPPVQYRRRFMQRDDARISGILSDLPASPTFEDMEQLVGLYDAGINFVDAQLDAFLTRLHAAGLLDNTIVAVTSDHGEEFFDHGRIGHGKTLYDETVQVPLILWYPGHLPSGRVVEEQVQLTDVAPALIHLAGVTAPAEFGMRTRGDGRLVGLARGLKDETPPPAVATLQQDFVSIRVGSFKLIEHLQSDRAAELFDLVQDPLEKQNIAASHADVVATLRAQLRAWNQRWTRGQPAEGQSSPEHLRLLKSLGYVN